MPKTTEVTRRTKNALTAEQAEELFTTVDETGHTDAERARIQRKRRKEKGHGVEIDPLAGEDPSGSDVDTHITRTAVGFVLVFLVLVTAIQVGWGYVRRVRTASLADDASVRSVVSAMSIGVEWGDGFTQFPAEFTVQEADENTHRIEVSVVNTTASDDLDCFASSQIQAAAFSVNALLNPDINTVIYHVNVRRDESGKFQRSQFFDFLSPTGPTEPFATFIWTKAATEDGVRFNSVITGVDSETQEKLRSSVTSKSTPEKVISYVMGDAENKTESSDTTED